MKISISSIRLFKACRRAWELRYVEGIQPISSPESSVGIGSGYHDKIRLLYDTGEIDASDLSKESAMALAYKRFIYPRFTVKSTETWIEKPLLTGDSLIGRVDAIADDGRIVEHKTVSVEITDEYEYNLMWDEQLLAYMLATGSRKAWYTVCRRPTIRQRQSEDSEAFFDRMRTWYDEDTDSKIRLLEVERTDREIDDFERDLCSIIQDVEQAKCTNNFYRNTCHCSHFGSRCEYSPICLHYDPDQEYIGFSRRDIG